MKHRHVIDLEDLTFAQLQQVIDLAGKIKADPAKYSHVCDGTVNQNSDVYPNSDASTRRKNNRFSQSNVLFRCKR